MNLSSIFELYKITKMYFKSNGLLKYMGVWYSPAMPERSAQVRREYEASQRRSSSRRSGGGSSTDNIPRYVYHPETESWVDLSTHKIVGDQVVRRDRPDTTRRRGYASPVSQRIGTKEEIAEDIKGKQLPYEVWERTPAGVEATKGGKWATAFYEAYKKRWERDIVPGIEEAAKRQAREKALEPADTPPPAYAVEGAKQALRRVEVTQDKPWEEMTPEERTAFTKDIAAGIDVSVERQLGFRPETLRMVGGEYDPEQIAIIEKWKGVIAPIGKDEVYEFKVPIVGPERTEDVRTEWGEMLREEQFKQDPIAGRAAYPILSSGLFRAGAEFVWTGIEEKSLGKAWEEAKDVYREGEVQWYARKGLELKDIETGVGRVGFALKTAQESPFLQAAELYAVGSVLGPPVAKAFPTLQKSKLVGGIFRAAAARPGVTRAIGYGLYGTMEGVKGYGLYKAGATKEEVTAVIAEDVFKFTAFAKGFEGGIKRGVGQMQTEYARKARVSVTGEKLKGKIQPYEYQKKIWDVGRLEGRSKTIVQYKGKGVMAELETKTNVLGPRGKGFVAGETKITRGEIFRWEKGQWVPTKRYVTGRSPFVSVSKQVDKGRYYVWTEARPKTLVVGPETKVPDIKLGKMRGYTIVSKEYTYAAGDINVVGGKYAGVARTTPLPKGKPTYGVGVGQWEFEVATKTKPWFAPKPKPPVTKYQVVLGKGFKEVPYAEYTFADIYGAPKPGPVKPVGPKPTFGPGGTATTAKTFGDVSVAGYETATRALTTDVVTAVRPLFVPTDVAVPVFGAPTLDVSPKAERMVRVGQAQYQLTGEDLELGSALRAAPGVTPLTRRATRADVVPMVAQKPITIDLQRPEEKVKVPLITEPKVPTPTVPGFMPGFDPGLPWLPIPPWGFGVGVSKAVSRRGKKRRRKAQYSPTFTAAVYGEFARVRRGAGRRQYTGLEARPVPLTGKEKPDYMKRTRAIL